ncbi:MAG: DNA polymerase IV [Patescibacteria group bacterium]|nr:DNA polymerase IV [Patescibacteria group bacterium]
MPRIIAHLDMDAFFAAVEERDRPKYKGQPIVVGSDPMEGKGRGVVSTANYKARKYGIRSATPISRAWQMSEEARKKGFPPAIFLFPNFKKYEKASFEVSKIVSKFSPLVEPASIDEMYFDLSPSVLFRTHPELVEGMSFCGNYKKAGSICKKIKNKIKREEKLTCSIGIGSNKLIAKIASDFKKPDGLTVVEKGKEEAFLENFPIRKIPGIGPKTEEILLRHQIKLVKDLKKFSKVDLKKILGKLGDDLYYKIRGVDDSPIVEKYEIKSIGEQETFSKDTFDLKFITGRMVKLSESVFERFEKSGFKNFKTITITVRFAGFETKNRSRTLAKPVSDLKTVQFEALKLLSPFFDKRENPKKKLIRLIGVRIEKLI